MNEIKISVYTLLLDTIKTIQDADFQERIWLRGEGPEVSDFGETINSYFDLYDGMVDLKKSYREYGLTFRQYWLIKRFSKKLRHYSDMTPMSPNDREIVADPRWHKIRESAKHVYAKLIGLCPRCIQRENDRFKINYASAILSMNRALLGEIAPALRAARIKWDEKEVHLYFYYDGEISEDDRESAECAAT